MTTQPLFETPQAWYDELVRRSKEGLFPSMNEEQTCVYRAPDGRKCAAGVLIPDDFEVTPAMEAKGPVALRIFKKEPWWPAWLTESAATDVQLAHDSNVTKQTPDVWSHREFVADLNHCPVFKDCNKVNPAVAV